MAAKIGELTAEAKAILRQGGDFESAEAALLEAWKLANLGDEVAILADLAHRLATLYRDHGGLERAEEFARRAVELEEEAGREALLGNHLMFLADLLGSLERYDEALPHAERAVRCYQHLYGPDHGETRYMMSVVVGLRSKAGGG